MERLTSEFSSPRRRTGIHPPPPALTVDPAPQLLQKGVCATGAAAESAAQEEDATTKAALVESGLEMWLCRRWREGWGGERQRHVKWGCGRGVASGGRRHSNEVIERLRRYHWVWRWRQGGGSRRRVPSRVGTTVPTLAAAGRQHQLGNICRGRERRSLRLY